MAGSGSRFDVLDQEAEEDGAPVQVDSREAVKAKTGSSSRAAGPTSVGSDAVVAQVAQAQGTGAQRTFNPKLLASLETGHAISPAAAPHISFQFSPLGYSYY